MLGVTVKIPTTSTTSPSRSFSSPYCRKQREGLAVNCKLHMLDHLHGSGHAFDPRVECGVLPPL